MNDYGLAIHKPQKVEVWLSDNDVQYWKVSEKVFALDEIFREGNFKEEMEFEIYDFQKRRPRKPISENGKLKGDDIW